MGLTEHHTQAQNSLGAQGGTCRGEEEQEMRLAGECRQV